VESDRKEMGWTESCVLVFLCSVSLYLDLSAVRAGSPKDWAVDGLKIGLFKITRQFSKSLPAGNNEALASISPGR